MPSRTSREIGKLNSRQSLVEILDENNKRTQWVVCSYYDGTKPFGTQWNWGHYFTSLWNACVYIATEVDKEE